MHSLGFALFRFEFRPGVCLVVDVRDVQLCKEKLKETAHALLLGMAGIKLDSARSLKYEPTCPAPKKDKPKDRPEPLNPGSAPDVSV